MQKGNLADIKFYSGKGVNRVVLKGDVYGVEGKIGNELEKALDSSLLSFYELEWESKNTGNLSLDFKSPKLISAISFCPRNDTNIIAVGDNYELFYWSNRWISLGEKVASDNFLLYDKVPKGALLW